MSRAAAATAVIALVALVAGVAIFSSMLSSQRCQREQVIGEIADLHVGALASSNPVDVSSTDREVVETWFSGKLPFAFEIPDLHTTPFQLMGARFSYVQHLPAVQLLLQVHKEHISVFIVHEAPGALPFSSGITVERELAFNLQSWSTEKLRYFVIGDASPRDLHDLSELLRNHDLS